MKSCIFLLCWILVFCTATESAAACTLFAANGANKVLGGGTLIAKNRDWHPQPQELRLVTSGKYRYYGLFAGDAGKRMQIKGGVNEKGLAVFSASASSIPKKERLQMPHASHGAMTTMLANCANVDEALQHVECFVGPKFLLLADASQAAWVEVGPEGHFSIKKQQNGTLVHTNHYLDTTMEQYNVSIGESSRMRYQRMTALLEQPAQPWKLEDFVQFSQDQAAGVDNSIWRSGSRLRGTQTLAVMAVLLQTGKSPRIYVKVRRQPMEKGLEDVYWLGGTELFPGE